MLELAKRGQYVFAHEVTCPHCGVDIAAMNAEYESAVAELEKALGVAQKAESRNQKSEIYESRRV